MPELQVSGRVDKLGRCRLIAQDRGRSDDEFKKSEGIQNDTAIAALLSKYAARAPTPAFTAAAESFDNYAISLRDRWQSAFEIYMAGSNLAAADPVYPPPLAGALDQEMNGH